MPLRHYSQLLQGSSTSQLEGRTLSLILQSIAATLKIFALLGVQSTICFAVTSPLAKYLLPKSSLSDGHIMILELVGLTTVTNLVLRTQSEKMCTI